MWEAACITYTFTKTTQSGFGFGSFYMENFNPKPTLEELQGIPQRIAATMGLKAENIVVLGWFEMTKSSS